MFLKPYSIDAVNREAPRGDRHKKSDDDLTFADIAVNRWCHPINSVYTNIPTKDKRIMASMTFPSFTPDGISINANKVSPLE